ncbi:hypothetical protein TELCIR_06252 [Teladorsagia circumcincta]|uniref:Uncharacterized protein n=1 Tax=Teladorsagia circumcincta TaxID=45464 RepID=A0A2G9UNG6_TELCI|nr:hypothetical protein TELCIR_06252 [Teladorsagia circumcincta]
MSIDDLVSGGMIYYKSTKAGCYYQMCPKSAPKKYAVACVFNSAPQLNQPIYKAHQNRPGNGCNLDANCGEIFTGATCGPQGLCGFK